MKSHKSWSKVTEAFLSPFTSAFKNAWVVVPSGGQKSNLNHVSISLVFCFFCLFFAFPILISIFNHIFVFVSSSTFHHTEGTHFFPFSEAKAWLISFNPLSAHEFCAASRLDAFSSSSSSFFGGLGFSSSSLHTKKIAWLILWKDIFFIFIFPEF